MKAVSRRELARVAERKGWQLPRVRGSHHLYGRGADRLVIPIHGNAPLKIGLLHDLMKQAGISEDDL